MICVRVAQDQQLNIRASRDDLLDLGEGQTAASGVVACVVYHVVISGHVNYTAESGSGVGNAANRSVGP